MLSLSLSSSLPFQSFAFPILSLTHDLFLSLSHTRYIYISLSLVYSARSAFAVLLLPGIISTYNVNVVVDVVVVVILWKLPPSNQHRFCHRINCLNLIKKYESEPFIAETFSSNHNKQVIICVCGQFPSTL